MRAMQLVRPGPILQRPLTLVDLSDPEPLADELLIDVAACAVCRTDLQLVEGHIPARVLPLVPGHQVVGRVRAVGSNVRDWAIGDRVGVAWLAEACGSCELCRSGRENLCATARFTGWDISGGFAERLSVHAKFVHRLPDTLGDINAAPLLCGGIIGYRSLRLSAIRRGGRLGLFGFGASALLTLQVARHWGCEVFVCTRSSRDRDRARALGAVWTGAIDSAPPVALDAAITFAPVGSVVVAALRAVGPGGTVAINAIHLDEVPAFSYDLLWQERSIRSVANFTRKDATTFLEIAGEIPLVTEVESYPLDAANEALRRVASGEVEGAAVLVI